MDGLVDRRSGALVISLDLELLWGLRDLVPPDGGAFRQRLLGVRAYLPRLLDLFEDFGIGATWATVGALFASGREELAHFAPKQLPTYENPRLVPFQLPPGRNQRDDPLHYGSDVIELIRVRPRHEIGLHTFSHYYCLEPGQTRATFQADLESAIAIARAHDVSPRSFVFPRHQVNLAYTDLLAAAGITSYRGTEQAWMDQPASDANFRTWARRFNRILDSYVDVSGDNVTPWSAVPQPGGLCNIPSSCFLRPYNRRLRHLQPLQFRRISQGIRAAARTNGIYHLWWHCYNFGADTELNLAFLRQILTVFADCRQRYGMQSRTMDEIATAVQTTSAAAEREPAAVGDQLRPGQRLPAPVAAHTGERRGQDDDTLSHSAAWGGHQ